MLYLYKKTAELCFRRYGIPGMEQENEMRKIKHPFIRVQTNTGKSYGGSQAWLPYNFLKKSGCGVIGATDVLLYLNCWHPKCQSKTFRRLSRLQMTLSDYKTCALRMWKYYLPVMPGFGINGLGLMLGINWYFLKNRIPMRAVWNVSGKKIWQSVDSMLQRDIPVILSVGPNFPRIWGKQKLNFYTKKSDGTYVVSAKTQAHYVTVTGRDESWICISSWGKEYYIKIEEYQDYVKKYSSYLVSNILLIKG